MAVTASKKGEIMMELYNPDIIGLTKYIFFTGKGGVGKTSVACATAVKLADEGKKTLLVSTDPASNLQDVFNTVLNNKGVEIKNVPNLVVANLDPVQAAAEYRESVIAPYREKLPDSVIENMEEQELKDYFPEFRKYEGQCRFQGCRHIHEPGCAVKEALENNEISRLRYEDYLELHQELKEKRRY